MVNQYLQIAIKVLVTGGLVLVIVWCALTIWQLWFSRTLVLVPFEYIREGKAASEVGQHFTQFVNQDLGKLQGLYTSIVKSNDDAMDSHKTGTREIDVPLSANRADLPMVEIYVERYDPNTLPVYSQLGPETSEPPPIEIEAFGVQFSTVLKSLSRWITQPYEIVGSVLESSEGISVYVEVRNHPTADRTKIRQNRWYVSQITDANEASFAVACRLFQVLSPIQFPGDTEVSDIEFCTMTRALESYQRYLDLKAEVESNGEAKEALTEAHQLISQLLRRKSSIAYVYKLAAYIYRAEGDIVNAETALTQYLEILNTQGGSDKEAELVSTSLRGASASDEVTVLRTSFDLETQGRIRPVRPGISVSSVESTAGTICCIVQDSERIQYVLSSDSVFRGSTGTPVIQPGPADGGQATDQIAELDRTIELQPGRDNRTAGAIARLIPGIEASNDIPGVGRIEGITSEIELGDTVRIVGRTSGLVEGRVTAIDVTTSIWISSNERIILAGMIETPKLSNPGDSGAPVLTTDNKLLGIVYASSSTTTLIIPIEPILEELDVELVQ